MKAEKENNIYDKDKGGETVAYIDASNIILSSQRVQIDIDFSTSRMLRHHFYNKITYITRIIHHIQIEKSPANT